MGLAWLALGANIGDPAKQLEEAIRRLELLPYTRLTKRSLVRVTKPWGKTDQNDFHNMAVEIETSLTPRALMVACLAIENDMGRERVEVWGPRNIDIDMIAYDRVEMASDTLTLPHPFAHERDFVLDPLTEIAPEVVVWIKQVAGKDA